MIASTTATTIVVVEDDELVAALVRAVLDTVAHWRVILAYDAGAALELLQHLPVDIMIVDVNLPGMSGIEMLAAIRDRGEREPTSVIVMSANVTRQRVEEALGSAGVTQFLSKPFDIDDLVAAVQRAEMQHQVSARPASAGAGAPSVSLSYDVVGEPPVSSPGNVPAASLTGSVNETSCSPSSPYGSDTPSSSAAFPVRGSSRPAVSG